MPKIKSDAEDIYLRATHMPRAIESLQQAFMGMYPASARTANFAAPAIVTRSVADETAYPNDASCRRFRQLSRLFADRAAKRCQYCLFFKKKLETLVLQRVGLIGYGLTSLLHN
jgi:acid phosphatase